MAEELLWLRCEGVACVSKYLSNIPTSVKLLQILTSSGSIFSIIAIKWIIGSQYNFITDEKYCHFTPLKHFLELLRSRFANILPVNRAEIHKSRPVPQNTWNAVYGVFYWAICASHTSAVACRAHFLGGQSCPSVPAVSPAGTRCQPQTGHWTHQHSSWSSAQLYLQMTSPAAPGDFPHHQFGFVGGQSRNSSPSLSLLSHSPGAGANPTPQTHLDREVAQKPPWPHGHCFWHPELTQNSAWEPCTTHFLQYFHTGQGLLAQ